MSVSKLLRVSTEICLVSIKSPQNLVCLGSNGRDGQWVLPVRLCSIENLVNHDGASGARTGARKVDEPFGIISISVLICLKIYSDLHRSCDSE